MQRVELQVSTRDGRGKGAARRTRATGHVPAIVYGQSQPVAVQVGGLELERVLHRGQNQLVDLKGASEVSGKLVLIKDLQRHSVSRELLHCDFLEVDTAVKITVEVALHFTGKAHGVEMGGVLETLHREVSVSCLPLAIPESFELDVSELDIGDTLHASDITLPEGVELESEPDLAVIHVISPRVEETPVEEGEEGELEGEGEGEGAPAAEGAAPAEGQKSDSGGGD